MAKEYERRLSRGHAGLPYRPFLYHLEQIQDLLLINDLNRILYYDRRSIGIHHPQLLKTINIMPDGEKPEWRVEEAELLRWMQHMGFRQVLYRTQRRHK